MGQHNTLVVTWLIIHSPRTDATASRDTRRRTPQLFGAALCATHTLCTLGVYGNLYHLPSLTAVVGRSSSYAVLLEASATGEDALLECLDELWRRHIIRSSASRVRIAVISPTTASAKSPMSASPPTRRRALHRHVADALAHVYAGQLDEVSSILARGLYGIASLHHKYSYLLVSQGTGDCAQAREHIKRLWRFAAKSISKLWNVRPIAIWGFVHH